MRSLSLIISVFLWSSACCADGKVLTFTSQKTFYTDVCEAIVQDALAQAGVQIEFKKFPSSRALELSNSGVFDGELCRIGNVTKKWKNLVQVNSSIAPFYATVFIHKNVKKNIINWYDLNELQVGILRGHIYSKEGTANLEKKNLIEFTTTEQVLEMLNVNRIDAAVLIRHNALEVIYQNPSNFQNIQIAHPNIGEYDTYVYLHKMNAKLKEKVYTALEEAKRTGRSKKIYDEKIKKHNSIIKTLQRR